MGLDQTIYEILSDVEEHLVLIEICRRRPLLWLVTLLLSNYLLLPNSHKSRAFLPLSLRPFDSKERRGYSLRESVCHSKGNSGGQKKLTLGSNWWIECRFHHLSASKSRYMWVIQWFGVWVKATCNPSEITVWPIINCPTKTTKAEWGRAQPWPIPKGALSGS
jgi:hypothetical protein